MNVYIICSVRNIKKQEKIAIIQYINKLEKKNNVFYPARDAPQDDLTGMNIVKTEIEAIKNCDEVHIFWDINSKGSHFDLGVAMALNKKIKVIKSYQPDVVGKSYLKVMQHYEQYNPCVPA